MTRPIVLGLLAFTAAMAAAPRRADAQLLAPGELSSAHADLEGDDRCASCHARGKQVAAERCLSCHKPLAERIRARAGLHGATYRGKACESCHVEHLGRSARLIRWPGGAMARLDHQQTGWPLEGAHRLASCAGCHSGKTKAGRASFLGAAAACSGCHRDPHQSRLGARCESCHDASAWNRVDLRAFDHARARYPLRGKHSEVACEGCHGQPARYRGVAFDTCTACHTDPHAGRYAQPCQSCHSESGWRGAAAREQARRSHPTLSLAGGHRDVPCERCHDRGAHRPPSRGRACAGCHRPVHEARFGTRCEACHAAIRWLGLPRAIGLAAHGQTPYPLAGAHRQVGCEKCHPASRPPAARFRQLAFDRCAACHADRHEGEFAARDGGECGGCHTVDGFAPARFGPAQHAATAFAIDGRHRAAPCSGCHPGQRPRLDWRQPRRQCAECHTDPHAGEFTAQMRGGGCAACHSTRSWSEPRVDHSTYPLTGAHARAACVRCHGRTGEAGAARYRGAPRECEGCHEDVHAGQFRLSAPARTCADCHSTERFAPIAAFDHAARTGLALEKKHELACRSCHPRAELRSGARAVRYRLGYRQCGDCHASPHREIAAPAGTPSRGALAGLACSDCHSAAGWRVSAPSGRSARFDHDRTGFPLRAAHRSAPCAGCHGGRARPRTECATCHADPHAGRLGTECAGCHRATAWSDTSVLERHRRGRLPLTGRHALIDCTACHRERSGRAFSAVPADCFACHAADYRRPGIHPDHDGDPADPTSAPLSRDCGQCHRTSAWTPAVVTPGSLGWTLSALGRAPERHDDRFLLSSGPHRGGACDSCHVPGRDGRRVRCTGCHAHDPVALRRQHRGRTVAFTATGCLTCHPGGRAR